MIESGAGKSTVADAVVGLVAPRHGVITINGVPLERLPASALRHRIGYVAQETVLYNVTIRDNVMWGRLSSSEADLDEAVRLAGAQAFVRRLPRGYDTSIGDCGNLLSGAETPP